MSTDTIGRVGSVSAYAMESDLQVGHGADETVRAGLFPGEPLIL
jgi:hypothetical protein